jgi:ubiquinone/menaquinone biosynthesis C-methylase UbiE/uncharacterized protein YbaR (Trm112 family)
MEVRLLHTVIQAIYECPACHGAIKEQDASRLVCEGCAVTYPVYRGVPDFRYCRRGFTRTETEEERLGVILEAFDQVGFEELLRLRYSFSRGKMPEHLWAAHFQHELKYREKGESRRFRIDRVLAQQGKRLVMNRAFLDIGCGSGTSLPWMMQGFEHGVGVDISLVDLLVGKKFYEDHGIDHIGLVCAFAEQLPFRDEAFDLINATDVIEHIIDGQEAFLSQAYRVLKAGGLGYLNSPNRYNLFGPEPHVRVWFVGFVPRRYMDAYVQAVRGVRYMSVRLLSYRELSKLLTKVCDGNVEITGPMLDPMMPATTLKARVVKACPALLSLVNRYLCYVTTDYQVVINKSSRRVRTVTRKNRNAS